MQKLNFNLLSLSFFYAKDNFMYSKHNLEFDSNLDLGKLHEYQQYSSLIIRRAEHTHDKMVIEHSLIRHPSQSSICDPPTKKTKTELKFKKARTTSTYGNEEQRKGNKSTVGHFLLMYFNVWKVFLWPFM